MSVKRGAAAAAILVVLIVLALYLRTPGAAPAGQAPLLSLNPTNFAEFERTFDQNSAVPRLVLLLSPT